MSKFEIKSRLGGTLFECELPAELDGEAFGQKLGFAVKAALKSNAVLTNAYLTGADLAGANLAGAVLTGAVLTGADLAGAES